MPTGPTFHLTLPAGIPGAVTGPILDHDVDYTEDIQHDCFQAPTTQAHPNASVVNYYRIAQREDVDFTVADSYPLYTVPTGLSMAVRFIVVRCTEATNVTAVAVASVDVGASQGAVYAEQQLLALDASGKRWIFPNGPGTQAILSAGETLILRVATAATADAQTVVVDVFGDEF